MTLIKVSIEKNNKNEFIPITNFDVWLDCQFISYSQYNPTYNPINITKLFVRYLE